MQTDLFDCDDAGYPVLRHEQVPRQLMAEAEEAISNCPEGAIRLTSQASES
jgi:ferredoxin